MQPRKIDQGTGARARVEAVLAAFDGEVTRMRSAFAELAAESMNADRVADRVKRKLVHMASLDQFMRKQIEEVEAHGFSTEEAQLFWAEFDLRWEAIDSNNREELKELLKHNDWFTISEFGHEADRSAWLIAQHADRDVDFQKRVLTILEKLFPLGETSGSNYAYLYDRVAVAENRPQRFGTQGRCVGPGRWEPWPSEDPLNLQARRDAMGLGSLEDNIRRVSKLCHGSDG